MPSLDDVLNELRSILVKLSSIDLWPPWDAVQTIVDAVDSAVAIASTPPGPDPAIAREAATDWTVLGRSSGRGHTSLVELGTGMSTEKWEGASGDSFRASVDAFAARADTIRPAADDVATALTTLAASMTGARSRHTNAFDDLKAYLTISWNDLNPLELADKLRGIVEAAMKAISDLIGAYEDAADAHAVCKEAVVVAMDQVNLPQSVPEGASPIDAVSSWKDHQGPLAGNVIERYNLAFGELSPAEREALQKSLADARSDGERAWIMAGLASGLTGVALANYIQKLRNLSTDQLGGLDPTNHPLAQPTNTTCGSSSLVMARMRNDPAYAMWMVTGYNPETGDVDPQRQKETPAEAQQRRFDAEANEMHDRTNALRDRDGHLQLPYPEVIGTTPWAVANEMSADHGSGVPETDYAVDAVDPHDRRASYQALTAAVENGNSVPMFVGNSLAPGHVVLVTGADNGHLTVYDPGNGTMVQVTREQFVNGQLPFGVPAAPLDKAGPMTEPWFTVIPK